MVLSFFFPILICSEIQYSVTANQLTISGDGTITRDGIRSVGNYQNIVSATIEEGVIGIGYQAFLSCLSLSTVYIPSSIEIIDPSGFSRCSALSRIIVSPDNEKYCNDDKLYALFDKNKTTLIRSTTLAQIEIPEGVETIGSFAFATERNFYVQKLTLPNSLVTIQEYGLNEGNFDQVVFKENPIITCFSKNSFSYITASSIMIPNSCTTIQNVAFVSSTIYNFVFQETSILKTIEIGAFSLIGGLKSITLPDSLESIQDSVFEGCTSLESIYIGSQCSKISLTAFSRCTKLSNITISQNNSYYSSIDGVITTKEKDTYIFIPNGRTNLTIPLTVTNISETLLQSQSYLTQINIDSNHPLWASENGILYSKDFSTLIAVCGGVTKITINSSTNSIYEKAAFNCQKLVSIEFPAGSQCRTLNQYCFAYTSIKSIIIPNSIYTIESYAFYNCSLLQSVVFEPNSNLSIINTQCFSLCAIENIEIPDSLTEIGTGAFAFNHNLSISFQIDSQVRIFGSYAFQNTGIVSISIPKTVEEIRLNCFISCYNLESISFDPESELKSIGETAFSSCTELRYITIPANVTVEVGAFKSCRNLVTVNHSLETIYANVFDGCNSLVNFTISKSTIKITESAFSNCVSLIRFIVDKDSDTFSDVNGLLYDKSSQNLIICPPANTSLEIPSQTSSIASSAFTICTNLKSISFVSCSKLIAFGESLFITCTQLQEINFPPLLQNISNNCFQGCKSLSRVVLPPLINEIGSSCFSNCVSLKTVIYCGSNIFSDDNDSIFQNTLVKSVYVSQKYSGNTFYSLPVSTKLTNDCVLTIRNTCLGKGTSHHFLYSIMLIFSTY